MTGYPNAAFEGYSRKRGYSRAVLSFLILGLGLPAVYLAGLAAADPLLTVRSTPEAADVIVVLGGDGPARADRAAEIYTAGLAPKVHVTGDGDCTYIAVQMTREGVIPQSITMECASGSTEENARFSAPILNGAGVRRAILVTSWFHSRRAVETFSSIMPSIAWLSLPTETPTPVWQMAFTHEGLQIMKEYPKTIVYRLRRLLDEKRHAAAGLAGAVRPREREAVE